MTDPFSPLVRSLANRSVRYVLIGVSAANWYTPRQAPKFVTDDWDLFLPPDADNLVQAWAACDDVGMDLWLGNEPLDRPRDRWLAERIVGRRGLTRVTGPDELQVDLTLVMQGFDFEAVWTERRMFTLEGLDVPTARLTHIIEIETGRGTSEGSALSGHPPGRAGAAPEEAGSRLNGRTRPAVSALRVGLSLARGVERLGNAAVFVLPNPRGRQREVLVRGDARRVQGAPPLPRTQTLGWRYRYRWLRRREADRDGYLNDLPRFEDQRLRFTIFVLHQT